VAEAVGVRDLAVGRVSDHLAGHGERLQASVA